jgi:hypothetical protein
VSAIVSVPVWPASVGNWFRKLILIVGTSRTQTVAAAPKLNWLGIPGGSVVVVVVPPRIVVVVAPGAVVVVCPGWVVVEPAVVVGPVVVGPVVVVVVDDVLDVVVVAQPASVG